MIHRFSSRQQAQTGSSLGQSYLNDRLKNAVLYDRIAGYFSPSILQVAGEAIEAIRKTRVICNSQIVFGRIAPGENLSETAFQDAMRTEWCDMEIQNQGVPKSLLERLYHLLNGPDKRLEIRVLPNDRFGLIHGKAGIITLKDGSKKCFLGSANETLSGWKLNYEIVWEDDDPESIAWVENEFKILWGDPSARELTSKVIDELLRTIRRTVTQVAEWKFDPEPAAPVIESPVYRKQSGLWNHQKYFVERAFLEHRKYGGARLVLADQVGLGKTLQLAMAAQLMALYGEKPVLVIAPRTLLLQWQEDLWNLLELPSAVWLGNCWVDENEIEHEKNSPAAITRCPRRIGLVSQGLITHGSAAADSLLEQEYECVIVDEAHRVRRTNLPSAEQDPDVIIDGNNLYKYINKIARKTKSLLLATATPVQMHPVEAWDLLRLLNEGSYRILGDMYSSWNDPSRALRAVLSGESKLNEHEFWQWVRNPLPPVEETTQGGMHDFQSIRESLSMPDSKYIAAQTDIARLDPVDIAKLQDLRNSFFENHNPFIRFIVQRSRKYLEETIDPETNQPYLPSIAVRLFGEKDEQTLVLSETQERAYQLARDYCALLSKRKRGSGFLETLLLRRIGSSLQAGLNTARKLLHGPAYTNSLQNQVELFEEEEDDAPELEPATGAEGKILIEIIQLLESSLTEAKDPKFDRAYEILTRGIEGAAPWLERGCILFSCYYDTARWIAERISYMIGEESIGLYAGSNRSAIFTGGKTKSIQRDALKKMVKNRELKILVGTDAASEGLNLQALGTLINIDLPWNPTRLEQRKGRIQRIGQLYPDVFIYNMRYRNSVEDEVHQALSARLRAITELFGQVPDTLEDLWVNSALGEKEELKKKINAIPDRHPFEVRYNRDVKVSGSKWETCAKVLDNSERFEKMSKGW